MTTEQTPDSLSYRDAGVDIDAGNALIERIKPIVKRTFRDGVMTGLGGFGALFELPLERYREPVLVSGTDGVGTKLKLALEAQQHQGIGIDLVAMCVNDILVTGAEPLFFLDYYATGRLDVDLASQVIEGIARGCELAGAALTGGETAEMPGMYTGSEYDLAGFCVGIVEKSRIIEPNHIQAGDALIGIASSGPHSNGYSLIRRILEHSGADLSSPIGTQTLGEALLAPTRIYVKPLLALIEHLPVHGLAHITGGGLPENLPRILPPEVKAVIRGDSWTRPAVFDWLQHQGNVIEAEMLRTFNCGVGMVACVPQSAATQACELLQEQGESAWILGEIQTTDSRAEKVEMV